MLRHLTLTLSLLVGLTFGASAFPTSYYASHSRLASGNWVKIKLTETGMHQFTYDQLREMGFSDPSRVQVYGYSATCDLLTNKFSTSQPDDLAPIATRHGNDKILFYGTGDYQTYAVSLQRSMSNLVRTRTPYDTGSYYFLSDTQAPVEVSVRRAVTPATSGLRIFDSHNSVQFFEEELQNEADGGVVFHGKDIPLGSTQVITFDIPGYWPENQLEGFSDTPGNTLTIHNRIGYRAPTANLEPAKYSCDQTFELSDVNDNGCYATPSLVAFYSTVQVCQLTPKDLNMDNLPTQVSLYIKHMTEGVQYRAEDYSAVVYARHNLLTDEVPQLLMTVPARCTSRHQLYFPEITSDELEVWNVSNLYNIDKYPLVNTNRFSDKTGVLFTSDSAGERLVAFKPDADFPSPIVIGKVPHQDLHSLETPDMVIITTPAMMQHAERLADLHRMHQGMSVLVVDHNLLYNEFSSGARSPMAYRRFLKMLYDRSHRLSHVLFFGPANFDNRCLLNGLDVKERLTLWVQDDEADASNLAVNYALDSRMGMLQDDYTTRYLPPYFPMQIAVGRLPMTAEEAPAYMEKVERWFTNPPSAEIVNNAVVIGGAGDELLHLNHAKTIIEAMQEANSNLNIRPLHTEMYPEDNNKLLADAFKSGVGYFEYSGHGMPVSIENWSLSDANNEQYEQPVIAMISSCDQFAMDHDALGLVRTMLNNSKGGIIAAVAASRGVYIAHNQRTAVPFSIGYAQARPGQTIGQIYRESRNNYIDTVSESDFDETAYKNMTSFNLAGDPAIPVYAPSHKVVIETIGENAFSENTPVTINPMQLVKVKGYIADADGQLDKKFGGDLTFTVYDSPRISTTYNTTGDSKYVPDTICDPSVVLARQIGLVERGRFEIEIAIPAPSSVVDAQRIIVTAVDDEANNRAIYAGYPVALADRLPSAEDLAALGEPEIIELEVEVDPASAFYSTGAKTTVTAVVDPSSAGLEFRSTGVNSSSMLTIDGVSQHVSLQPYMKSDGDGIYLFEIPVDGLVDGAHTARLTLVTTTGESVSYATDFTVMRETLTPALVVAEGTVTGPTEISLDTECDYVELVINDAAGHHVFSADNITLPFTWDLLDNSGKEVEDGRYDVVARVRNGSSYGSAKAQIIILK